MKIVAVTASGFADQRDEVLAAGFDDFVRKPYCPDEIFECIARQLGVRYLKGEARGMPAAEPVEAIRPDALAALPGELRRELANALIFLDVELIAGLIGRVSERDEALGRLLSRAAARFAYTELLGALTGGDGSLDLKGRAATGF